MWKKARLPAFLLPITISLGIDAFAQSSSNVDFTPVTQSMLNDPNPQDWLMWP